MANELVLLDHTFESQKEAEAYFYALRDKYSASAADITQPQEFELLRELYLKYCEYTDWPVPASPIAFCVRNVGRGVGGKGGTTQAFVVRFNSDAKTDKEFSAKKAIQAIAKHHATR